MAKGTSIKVSEMTGVEKAATFMMSMDSELAAKVMAKLDEQSIESLTTQIARMDELPKNALNGVMKEYETINSAMGAYLRRGREFAIEVLTKALGPEEASVIIERVLAMLDPSGFDVLNEIDDEQLLGFMQKEHSQTIALILGNLKPRQAAAIMGRISPERRSDIIARIATMENVSPDVINEVKESLNRLFSSWKSAGMESSGGVEVVAEILNLLDRTTEKKIMATLETDNAQLAANIKTFLFTFEDILNLQEADLRNILKEIDSSTLVLAMKAASDELKETIFSNVSQRAADMLRDEMEFMGPVRLRDVEEAQSKVIDVVLRLDEAGQITIARAGEGDEIIA